ncbi:MAG: hypothetical protein LAT51_13040 [Flavobacteriaceae bacterium]|nr:hypothetical protein [Flavobacteriaceae bacterium]
MGLNNSDFLDSRIKGHFTKREKIKPVHECARFIINDLLKSSGPLINELTLGARLGVNVNSLNDWQSFKESALSDFKYRGSFSNIWQLWWASELENWWAEKINSKKPLQLLKAAERVDLLNKKFNLNFSPANPIEDKYSTEYWTICQDLNRPLDAVDGFMIESNNRFAWQDELYINKKSTAERTYVRKGINIHQVEKDRLIEFLSEEE